SGGGAPAPRRPAAQFSGCSPRTAGPQPRDVLRLSSPDARLGRRGPSPATSCGSVLRMLASDGGAPAPRRPAAHTASLGGGFGKGGEAPSEFDGMAILVTGAFGCIGAWVVKRLLAAGERPVVYDLGDDPWRMRMIVGSEHLYGPGPVTDDAPPKPATHYGVYKVANEETARIYWEEHRIPSMGFRPLSVYGPGRDFGVTADPTLAMKAAVLGRPFQIRWGG